MNKNGKQYISITIPEFVKHIRCFVINYASRRNQLQISKAYFAENSTLYPMCLKECKKIVYVFAFFFTFMNIQKFISINFLFIIFLISLTLLIFSRVKFYCSLFKYLRRLNKNFRGMFSTEITKTFEPTPDLLKSKFNVCKKKYKDVFSLICSFNNLFRA